MKHSKVLTKVVSTVLAAVLSVTTVFSTGLMQKTVKAASETTSDSELTISRDVKKVDEEVNTWDITLSVSGKDKKTDSYVVFVIDRSNSMKGNYLTKTKEAANSAIDTLFANDNTYVAVVSYGSDVTSDGKFYSKDDIKVDRYGNVKYSAENAVESITIDDWNGGTNIQAGIKEAEELLARKNGNKTIILLSDGEPTYAYQITGIDTSGKYDFNACYDKKDWHGPFWYTLETIHCLEVKDYKAITNFNYNKIVGQGSSSNYYEVLKANLSCEHDVEVEEIIVNDAVVKATLYEAAKAKSNNISIYSIALGNVSEVGKNVLNQVSTNGSAYTASTSELKTVYGNIAGKVLYAASGAILTETIGEYFNLVENSAKTENGTCEAKEDIITWNIGNISNNKVATLTYRVKVDETKLSTVDETQWYPTNNTATVSYKNNNNEDTKQEYTTEPNVQIAKFYSVKYLVDGNNSNITDSTSYINGASVTVTSEIPSKEGYRFAGWKYNNTLYNAEDTVTVDGADVVFEASFVKTYNVNYYLDNAKVENLTKTYDKGTDVSKEVTEDSVKTLLSDKVAADKLITNVTVSGDATAFTSDVNVYATTATKNYTITYVVDGNIVGTETVEYGNDAKGINYTPTTEGHDFNGFGTLPTNVTSDTTVNATTSLKKFTVTFIVDDTAVKTLTGVTYGSKVEMYAYTPDEGYNFSGFTMTTANGNLANVTTDLVLKGTTSKKTYTVTFKDYDETVLSTESVIYGEAAKKTVKNPTRETVLTEGNKETNTPASGTIYTFSNWAADGDYTVANTESVKSDMTFTAVYNESAVQVKFYVLNLGRKQPDEANHYSEWNYSKGVAGTLYSFTAINNDDAAVAANICTAPDGKSAGQQFKLYNSDKYLELNEDQDIKWYVIKKEGSVWHVDGIVTNQKYDLTINYVESGTGNVLRDKETVQFAATDTYEIKAPKIEGFTALTDNVTSYTMDYDKAEVTLYYSRNSYNVTITYKAEDADKEFAVRKMVLPYGSKYSEESPAVSGYTADKTVVEGTVEGDVNELVTYTANSYNLTVKYVDEDGNKVADDYTTTVKYKSDYKVTSPVVTGYTASNEEVTGTMPCNNVTVEVAYTTNKHALTINYYYTDAENNQNLIKSDVATYAYNEKYSVEVADMDGYSKNLEKVEGTMGDENVTVDVIYTPNEYTVTVNYVYDDGNTVLDDNGNPVVATLKVLFGDSYRVETAAMTGFTPDTDVVEGTITTAADVEDTVVYNRNTYKLIYIVDGEEVVIKDVKYGDIINIFDEDYEVIPNYEFSGWSTDTTNVDGAITVLDNIKVIGTTKLVTPTDEITYVTPKTREVEADEDEIEEEPEVTPTKPAKTREVEADEDVATGVKNVALYISLLGLGTFAVIASVSKKKRNSEEEN